MNLDRRLSGIYSITILKPATEEKPFMTRSLSAAVLCLFCACLMAHAAPKTLDDLREIYEKSVQKIEADYQEAAQAALTNYGKWLDQIIEVMKRKADIKGYEATKNEQERLEAENTVSDDSPAGLPELLVKAQSAYRQHILTAEGEKNAAMLKLIAKYIPTLDALKKQLMANEEVDEAKLVLAEVDRVDFVQADIEARMPKPEPRPEPRVDEKKDDQKVALQDLLDSEEFCEGLVLYYPFDGDKKHSVADESGNRNHGKVNGAKHTQEGKFGGARVFDGEAFIQAGSPDLAVSDEVTVLAWVRPDTSHGVVAGKGWTFGGIEKGWIVHIGSNHFSTPSGALSWGSSDGSENMNDRAIVCTGRGMIATGKWQFIAVTKSGTSVEIYLDGVVKKRGLVATTDIAYDKNDAFVVGQCLDKDRRYYDDGFKGTIDELMIWNRALSKEEINRLYEATKGD
ncbi:LamG domain-containing protein [Verrucomicrobiota bacterium]